MCQGSRVSEMMEGWQEARSHRQQSPLPAFFFFFFFLGIYSIFKRSQIWNRAAILLTAIATEQKQFAESTQQPMFPERHCTDLPVCRGNPAGWGHMQTCAHAKQLCIPEAAVCMPEVLGSLCDLQSVRMRCGCAGLLSIQQLSQMSRNPRQMQQTLQICLGKIPVRKIKGTF